MTTPLIRIVDDEEQIRSSRRFYLEMLHMDVADYASAEEFLERDDIRRPGCLILDLRLTGMDGLQLQAELKRRGSTLPILFVSGHGDIDSAVKALKNGAFDFLQKPVHPEKLLEAAKKLVDFSVQQEKLAERCAEARRRVLSLTPRERTIAERVARGQLNKVIAADLGLADQSVKIYRSNLCRKLDVRGAVKLAALLALAGVGQASREESLTPPGPFLDYSSGDSK